MDVEINYAAVVLAAISTMVVGSTWYAPAVFGDLWMKLIGKSPKELRKDWNPLAYLYVFAASLITAFVLAHVTYLSNQFFENSFVHDALMTGLWLWLGMVAARILTHDVFERRPYRLTLLTVGHEFITIMVMALIIGLIKP